jgi:hypothetical protein
MQKTAFTLRVNQGDNWWSASIIFFELKQMRNPAF